MNEAQRYMEKLIFKFSRKFGIEEIDDF